MFEMLIGYPPFYSEKPSDTWLKISNWKKYFRVPKEAKLSHAATDLLERLVCDKKDRLGKGGASNIKKHPFFKGIDWENLRNSEPAYKPTVNRAFDTNNFDHFEDTIDNWSKSQPLVAKTNKQQLFAGYNFKALESSALVRALIDVTLMANRQHPLSSKQRSNR
jgi:serine/threonine kinase 38